MRIVIPYHDTLSALCYHCISFNTGLDTVSVVYKRVIQIHMCLTAYSCIVLKDNMYRAEIDANGDMCDCTERT